MIAIPHMSKYTSMHGMLILSVICLQPFTLVDGQQQNQLRAFGVTHTWSKSVY